MLARFGSMRADAHPGGSALRAPSVSPGGMQGDRMLLRAETFAKALLRSGPISPRAVGVEHVAGSTLEVAMYHVVIVEDDADQAALAAAKVEEYARQRGGASSFDVRRLTNVDELASLLESGDPIDILFMDIVFDGEDSGIDAVKRLVDPHRGIQVIYMTGYIEYCTQVYDTKHVYFLLKPLRQEDFDKALDAAIGELAAVRHRSFPVKAATGVVNIRPRSIRYVESDRRKVRFFTDEGVVETYASISSVSDRLSDSFVRCHKSYIVNLGRIAELQLGEIVLTTGERVLLSRRRRKDVREAFLRYVREGRTVE